MTVDKQALTKAQNELNFETNNYELHMDTTLGPIRLEYWPDLAPGHCRNMLGLAKVGFYDGIKFHRIVKGFVIQGGCPKGTGTGGPGYTIDAEFSDRPHEAGVLSMARTQDPNSAGSQFFLCLEKVPYLDGQYTVFGQTKDAESLATVKAIGAVATGPGDGPVEDVVIKTAVVVETPR